MSGGGHSGRELDQTPTWAVAVVVTLIIIISIGLEKILHAVFEHKKKEALLEALEKVKGELMVLGFISLLLTFGQNYISKICIPEEVADTMLFCPKRHAELGHGQGGHGDHQEEGHGDRHEKGAGGEEHHRRLLFYDDARRFLSGHDSASACDKGYVPLISVHALHQLHIFIFFLAVFHVAYSATTMMLGRLKTRGWKEWERECINSLNELNDPSRFRLTHETSFVRDHTRGWHIMTFMSMMPLVLTLAVGTKLQAIIARMALEIVEKHAVIQGMPLVSVTDKHFWFAYPPLCLHLIHYVLFQVKPMFLTISSNIQYEFGLNSCFHEDFTLITIRVCLGVVVQFICSYITLPLYALVTQMGSTMKRSIFDEQTSKALKQWHKKAAQKTDHGHGHGHDHGHDHGKKESSHHEKKPEENGVEGATPAH
ncbi:MLO-like protein 5 [Hibiscus syriacus]|uniref:MLO-like protein n=1 Tax=Hibiscus syriacus TaxID=106335 RepID=A0A6A2YAM5_HIBSY|nr:MLO-like protein 5 [Hibiscus syriacus]